MSPCATLMVPHVTRPCGLHPPNVSMCDAGACQVSRALAASVTPNASMCDADGHQLADDFGGGASDFLSHSNGRCRVHERALSGAFTGLIRHPNATFAARNTSFQRL